VGRQGDRRRDQRDHAALHGSVGHGEADSRREGEAGHDCAGDGERQAAILKAEGQKQSAILQAEGERQAAILRAEGQAKALELLNEAASKLGQNAILLQYLDALKAMAASPSAKIVLPMEVLTFLQSLVKKGEG
jgi:regulator of protease activity HflC (stomatin/prohibitin superfamily)